jgi:uncharacterized membrane protein
VYGVVLLMNAIAYSILSKTLISLHGHDSTLAKAVGSGGKGKLSLLIYIVSILLCFLHPLLGFAGYVFVAIIWFIPDLRIEKKLVHTETETRRSHSDTMPV